MSAAVESDHLDHIEKEKRKSMGKKKESVKSGMLSINLI